MKKARLKIDRDYQVCKIDKRIFGSFIEHMGRVVYTGIFEKDHPLSDENGFRTDVLEYVKRSGLSVMRYPGGNFTSAYHWEDTVGPVEERPVCLELAWKAIEPNTFGLNEFLHWSKLAGTEPMLTLNLGTRGIEDACHLVEYCNSPEGTRWSNLRVKHGFQKPHKIKLWCLGNELDGPWQMAGKTAEEYGRLANETSKAIKWIDPEIETVAVGSSTPILSTYPEWDRKVLMECYDNVDYLSLHNYVNRAQDEELDHYKGRTPDDIGTWLSRSEAFDRQIRQLIAVCDYVQAVKRSDKVMYLSFDEWNVHRHPETEYEPWKTGSAIDWCHFDMADTLLFGGMLLAILRHADRVKIACQSLLVNTIPLILTEKGGKAWANPTYYVLRQAALHGRGILCQGVMECDVYDSQVYTGVPEIDYVVIQNENDLTVFALNRGDGESELEIQVSGYQLVSVIEHEEICAPLDAKNTKEQPETVIPVKCSRTQIEAEKVKSVLQPYSWNMIRLEYQIV